MNTNVRTLDLKTAVVTLLASVLVVLAFVPAQYAHAQTTTDETTVSDDKRALMQELLGKLLELRKQMNVIHNQIRDITGTTDGDTDDSDSNASDDDQDDDQSANADNQGRGNAVSACRHAFKQTLGLGARGTDVEKLQEFLNEQGFMNEDATGYYGQLTERAIQRFQAAHNVVATGTPAETGFGRVGPRTLARLNSVCAQHVNNAPRFMNDNSDDNEDGTSTASTTFEKHVRVKINNSQDKEELRSFLKSLLERARERSDLRIRIKDSNGNEVDSDADDNGGASDDDEDDSSDSNSDE